MNFCLDLSKILVNGILLKLPTYFVVVKQGKQGKQSALKIEVFKKFQQQKVCP